MLAEGDQIEILADDGGNHSSTTFRTGNRYAVNHRFDHAGMRAHSRGDFGGRYVLALPPERVANPVDEIVEPALVAAHKIAGTKPCVAVDEHVAQDLSFGGGLVRIAFEAAGGIRSVAEDLTDGLAGFVGRTADAETFVG